MRSKILLLDDSEESEQARKAVASTGMHFDILPAHPFWREIDWPIPSFFTKSKIYKGIEEIAKIPEEYGYEKPN